LHGYGVTGHRPLPVTWARDAAKADMTAVKVIRQEDGQTRNYVLNLKQILDGGATKPFYLRKSDIIYVPEKFSWF